MYTIILYNIVMNSLVKNIYINIYIYILYINVNRFSSSQRWVAGKRIYRSETFVGAKSVLKFNGDGYSDEYIVLLCRNA